MDNKQKVNKQRNSIFDVISEKTFSLLRNGMFGSFFTSYDDANQKYLKRIKRKKGLSRSGKRGRKVSRLIERSFFVNSIPKFMEGLLRISLRDYGIMLFVMGALISVLYPMNGQIASMNVSLNMFISGIAICLSAIPMLFSSKSLANNLYSSKLCNAIFFRFLGFNKEKMRETAEKEKISIANAVVFIGIGLGILSYFMSPFVLLGVIGTLVLSYCILRTPEIGVIVMVLALPFAPVEAMQVCVAFVFICYLLKCIVGKRTFKFEYFDIWVVLVLLVTLIRGSISSSPIISLKSSLASVSLILSYFIVTNLIHSKEWFRRCLVAFVTAGLVVSVIAIIQLIFGELSVRLPDLGRLFTKGQSVTSVFGDPDILAHFLVAIIPFTLVHFISERVMTKKTIGFIIGACLIVAMAFTHSLSGVVGILCAALLLLVIFNRNFVYLALVAIASGPLLYHTLPENALSKILSTKLLEGITISGTVQGIRDGFKLVMSKPFGVGSGSEVFNNAFNTDTGYANNLIFQVLLEYGIIGFIAFTAFIIMLMRLTFSYCVKAKNQYRKINCCAGFCSVVGLLTSGMISYVWNDKRLYLLFWLLVALSFAYMRIERQIEEPKGLIKDFTSATLEVVLTGDSYHDTVPKRRYVHLPKASLDEDDSVIVKEFNVKEENTIQVIEVKEEENQENGKSE